MFIEFHGWRAFAVWLLVLFIIWLFAIFLF